LEKRDCKNVVIVARLRQFQSMPQIQSAVFEVLNGVRNHGRIEIPSHAKIMIKPNICFVKRHETGATVDPFVVRCLVDWLLENYNIESITIGEADATELNVEVAFKVLGWEDMFKTYPDVRLLNLSKDKRIKVKSKGFFSENLYLSKTYMEADFLISVAKLKTHTLCRLTCALKNQFGANPVKRKIRYHKNLDEVIYELNKAKIPNLCLVDAIIGMEGEGPVKGIPKPLGIVVAGNDVVAVDHLCAKIAGVNPDKISYLRMATERKLGSVKYDVLGESVDPKQSKFAFVPRFRSTLMTLYQEIRSFVNF